MTRKSKTVDMDGSKVHANASKSKAVSYQRLLESEEQRCPDGNQVQARVACWQVTVIHGLRVSREGVGYSEGADASDPPASG